MKQTGMLSLAFTLGPGISKVMTKNRAVNNLVFDPPMQDASIMTNLQDQDNGAIGYGHTYTVTMDEPGTMPDIDVAGNSSNMNALTDVMPTDDPLIYEVTVLLQTSDVVSTEMLTIDFQAVPVGITEQHEKVDEFSGLKVGEAFPNPFKNSVTFSCETQRKEFVEIDIFNLHRQHIAKIFSGFMPAYHEKKFTWDGADIKGTKVLPGLYLLKIATRDTSKVIKLYKA